MSFTRFLESKKRSAVQLSLEHYREVLERDVYDALLDPIRRDECFLTHLAEIMDLRPSLVRLAYPKTDELLMSVAARAPVKIRRAHEQFTAWAKGKDLDVAGGVETALFECRAYLYGKDVEFSKEIANKIVESVAATTGRNVTRIVDLMERAINRIHNWHGSSVIFKILKPDDSWISNEGIVIVGQPPSMTFMCNNNKPTGLELYDIQDIEGYPISIQEDYTSILRSLQATKPRATFQTMYVAVPPKQRQRYEHVKRELALGIEATLPTGAVLEESPTDQLDMDVWRIKLKNNMVDPSEAPIRWLDLFRKAE